MNYRDLYELMASRPRAARKPARLPYDQNAPVTRPVEVLAPTTGTVGELVTRAMPLTGEAWAAHDVRDEAKKGNYGAAAVAAALGLLPFGGTIAGLRQAGKAFPMSLGKGDFLTRTQGSLPHSVNMQGFHWSPEANLGQTDPSRYGIGIKGAEAGRLAGQPDIRSRTYFYDNDVSREAGLGPNQYRGTLTDVYPESDPLGFRAAARKKFPQEADLQANELERLIKGSGYKGYENRGMVSYFDPVSVAPHVQGTAIPEPVAPSFGMTDTTEVMQGNRTGHMQLPGPMPQRNFGEEFEAYQNRLMKTLESQNRKLYSAVDPNGRGAVTQGYYRTPSGNVENNPTYAHSLPYSEEAERAVGAISPLNALIYGQNAYGYSGLRPGSSGGAGLRTSIAGATPSQKNAAVAALEDRGILATPTESGMTVGGFSPMPEEAIIDATTQAYREAGIPRATAMAGEHRSGYGELPWGEQGAGTATQAALAPMLQLPPNVVQTLDRTGQFQEAGRLLNAADSGFSGRFDVPVREDLMSLREILRQGGLKGLLTHVQEHGYKGLPAVLPIGIGLDREEERRLSW